MSIQELSNTTPTMGDEHPNPLPAARRPRNYLSGADVAGLFLGALFGATLVAARLNDYNVIHRALSLRDPYMFLVMSAAIAVAAPGLWLLERAHPRTLLGGPLTVKRERIRRKHLLGALVFGAGWALAGTCPGPAVAMTASGNALGGVVMLGLWAGGALRDLVAPIMRASSSARGSRSTTPGSPWQSYVRQRLSRQR